MRIDDDLYYRSNKSGGLQFNDYRKNDWLKCAYCRLEFHPIYVRCRHSVNKNKDGSYTIAFKCEKCINVETQSQVQKE